jgi:hypothetical protein
MPSSLFTKISQGLMSPVVGLNSVQNVKVFILLSCCVVDVVNHIPINYLVNYPVTNPPQLTQLLNHKGLDQWIKSL